MIFDMVQKNLYVSSLTQRMIRERNEESLYNPTQICKIHSGLDA